MVQKRPVRQRFSSIGGKKPGKRGRGAKGEKPVLVAVERRGKTAGFVAVKAVDTVSGDEIDAFLKRHLKNGQQVRTNALPVIECLYDPCPCP